MAYRIRQRLVTNSAINNLGVQNRAASLAVLGEGSEFKNWMLEQPVKTKCCSSFS